MLQKTGHKKLEDFSVTLYGVGKETAVCSNAGTFLIDVQGTIKDTTMF